MKNQTLPPESNDILTYRRLRKIIGLLAFSLPVTLVILSLIPLFKTSIQSSISYYYYSNLREILTGVLCAVSLFLIRYRGFDNPVFWKNDNIMTNAAGFMALGVAMFPPILITALKRYIRFFHSAQILSECCIIFLQQHFSSFSV